MRGSFFFFKSGSGRSQTWMFYRENQPISQRDVHTRVIGIQVQSPSTYFIFNDVTQRSLTALPHNSSHVFGCVQAASQERQVCTRSVCERVIGSRGGGALLGESLLGLFDSDPRVRERITSQTAAKRARCVTQSCEKNTQEWRGAGILLPDPQEDRFTRLVLSDSCAINCPECSNT